MKMFGLWLPYTEYADEEICSENIYTYSVFSAIILFYERH